MKKLWSTSSVTPAGTIGPSRHGPNRMPSAHDGRFEKKILRANVLIQKALRKHKTPVVACSFGKHSMVVLHLVRQQLPNIKVIWNNTGVEYPDTYNFVRRIREEWTLQVIEARPTTTFWNIVDQNGFSIHPRNATWELQRASTECCRQLKKKPTMKVLREVGCDLYFTGLTQYESSLRRMSARKYGKYFYSVKWKHWKCHPILDWTTGLGVPQDVSDSA